MPRNIRPSWIEVDSDARRATFGTGPTRRDGQLTADLKVRENGDILDLLHIAAIGSGDKETVLVEITDKRTGRVIFSERFQQ
jgi:hypothetical protein